MSEEATAVAPAEPASAPAPKKSGGGIVSMILPALVAGGAAFGAVKMSAPHGGAPEHHELKPPGPTLQLEPFLITVGDANKHTHPMKVTMAVELGHGAKEEELKAFTPRIRDACLGHLRALTYEQAVDREHLEKLRGELVKKIKEEAGMSEVERVLITDFVVQ